MSADFTFRAIDLGITDDERKAMADEALAVEEDKWRGNNYRGCKGLPVFGDLVSEDDRFKGVTGNLVWTAEGQRCPTMMRVYNEKIRPILDKDARINILKTYAGNTLHEHYDCQESEIGTTQHKLRVVLAGRTSALYFVGKDGERWNVPDHYNTYVMDGGHLHALEESEETKLTMCLGAPWRGGMTPEYEKALSESTYSVKMEHPRVKDELIDPRFKK